MTLPEYHDDLTILNEDHLWRRIHPKQCKYDDNLGRFRPSRKAFQDSSSVSPMSVVLAKEHSNPKSHLEKYKELKGIDYLLASITAGLARECCQGVAREPQHCEPAHAVVFGKKTPGVRKRFAKEAEWVVPPPSQQ